MLVVVVVAVVVDVVAVVVDFVDVLVLVVSQAMKRLTSFLRKDKKSFWLLIFTARLPRNDSLYNIVLGDGKEYGGCINHALPDEYNVYLTGKTEAVYTALHF